MHRLLVLLLLAGCAAAPREVVLVEMQSERVEELAIGLRRVESRKMWREGKHVTVELATLLRLDPETNTVRSETFLVGDEIVLGQRRWSIARVDPGGSDTRGKVVLRAIDP